MNALYELARPWVLRVLRVPHDPAPPIGSPGSLKVFRAGHRYYRLKLALWMVRQVGVLAAFAFTLLFLHFWLVDPPQLLRNWEPVVLYHKHQEFIQRWRVDLWILLFECLGFAFALLQIPFTYAMVRMDYEYRWYLVTDRSLRIRTGLTFVRESTFSFANIQQIVVRQGPLQRLLGLGDVVVTTAGGGGTAGPESGKSVQAEPMHQGILMAVENPDEIRDLIKEHLRRLRSAGLGDPDDDEVVPTASTVTNSGVPLQTPGATRDGRSLAAARELLDEARKLRGSLERRPGTPPDPTGAGHA